MIKHLRRLDEPPLVNRVAFEIWILLAGFISGVGILATGAPPGSLSSLISPPFVLMWAITMVAGSATIVYALLVKERLKGLLIEYWTLFPFGASLGIYGIVAIIQVGFLALLPGLLSIAAGAACFTTAWFIKRTLDKAGLWKNGLGKFTNKRPRRSNHRRRRSRAVSSEGPTSSDSLSS